MMMQRMSSLPPQRLTPNDPPFKFTGLDFFGPILTKLARKEFKRYGCIFTCLCSRAVHLEMSYDLSTDSFLSCLARFTARRGRPSEIMSDKRNQLCWRGEGTTGGTQENRRGKDLPCNVAERNQVDVYRGAISSLGRCLGETRAVYEEGYVCSPSRSIPY